MCSAQLCPHLITNLYYKCGEDLKLLLNPGLQFTITFYLNVIISGRCVFVYPVYLGFCMSKLGPIQTGLDNQHYHILILTQYKTRMLAKGSRGGPLTFLGF